MVSLQIAGIILDNFARGRRRALWVSTSSDLHHDAERDLCDLGCSGINVINNCQVRQLSVFSHLMQGLVFDAHLLLRSDCASSSAVFRLSAISRHMLPCCLQALDRGNKALGLSKDLKEGVLFM